MTINEFIAILMIVGTIGVFQFLLWGPIIAMYKARNQPDRYYDV